MDEKLSGDRNWAEEKPDEVIEKLEIAKQELDQSFKGRLTRKVQPLIHRGDEIAHDAYDRLSDLGASLKKKLEHARDWLVRKAQSLRRDDPR